MWYALFLLACNQHFEADSTSDPLETGDLSCDTLDITVQGEDPPPLGATWTVGLLCDGSHLYGATVVRVEPADAALIDNAEVTFDRAGDLTLWVQVGCHRASRPVTVLP